MYATLIDKELWSSSTATNTTAVAGAASASASSAAALCVSARTEEERIHQMAQQNPWRRKFLRKRWLTMMAKRRTRICNHNSKPLMN
jgi:hypothetical protein